jgi:hypothetical protein
VALAGAGLADERRQVRPPGAHPGATSQKSLPSRLVKRRHIDKLGGAIGFLHGLRRERILGLCG